MKSFSIVGCPVYSVWGRTNTKSEVNLTTALLGFQVLGTLLKFKDGLGKSFVETFFDRVENHLGA